MKFAALALTLLLAVGSHGDAWPGDHLKLALPGIKERIIRVVEALSGTEYEGEVPLIKEKVEFAIGYITNLLDSDETRSAYTAAKTRSDEIANRWENSEVRSVIMQRKNEYQGLLSNFLESNKEGFENLKLKLVEAISKNHEETTRILKEGFLTVYQEALDHMKTFWEATGPYAQEYVEQMKGVMTHIQGSNLRGTIQPKLTQIREKIVEIYGDVLNEINKH